MKRFRLHEPATVEDAVARLARHGPAARPLGAGTDLVAGVMRDLVTGAGMAYPEHLVDLTTVPALADSLARQVRARTTVMSREVRVVRAALGDSAGIFGAADRVWSQR